MRRAAVLLCAGLIACSDGGSTPEDPAAGPEGIRIGAIQGSGEASPLLDRNVTVTGIVTGDFQNGDTDAHSDLGGFFLQQQTDGSPDTSDGIFVFDGEKPRVDVSIGDRVSVAGIVKEHFGETQIVASSVVVSGRGRVAIAPTEVTLPESATVRNEDGVPIPDLEKFEGMLLRFPQSLTVTAVHELERYGSVQLSQGGRQYQFTSGNAPDVEAYARYREVVGSRSILLDDGRRAANVMPIRLLRAGSSEDYSLRTGDKITGATGNLRFSRGSGGSGFEGWRLMPTEVPVFASDNPRPGAPEIDGTLRVAAFNVLNFFSTLDTGEPACGINGDEDCRGADSDQEFRRQLEKTVTALRMMNADIVGLMELENNASASLAALVDGLNDALGEGTYTYIDTGVIGADVIKTGFIYRPASVAPRGRYAVLDDSVDATFRDAYNRPALAQTFDQNSNGARLTIVVNHLKSKGADCDDVDDPNTGDGQGNCAGTRTAAATAIAKWLPTDPTGSDDPDFLIIGDLNAYLMEDAIVELEAAGYTNLIRTNGGPTAYSFVWDGQAGALDHALASPSLVPQVVDVLEWHINADEPPVLDYNLTETRDPALFDPDTPYRASDHDPVIVGLDLAP